MAASYLFTDTAISGGNNNCRIEKYKRDRYHIRIEPRLVVFVAITLFMSNPIVEALPYTDQASRGITSIKTYQQTNKRKD